VLLPAAAWGEKEGTVTSSERRISRQRAFVQPPGEARPDWWIISAVARRMGFGASFGYDSPHQIFSEHARLSALSGGARAFDIGGLAGLDAERYSSLEPIQWPVTASGDPGCQRLLASGRFYHGDQKARLVPTPPRSPGHAVDHEFPLVLNTGRVRDHWHTMTRTGRSARLSSHSCEPYVDLHGSDALVSGVQPGDLARVATRWGALVARVRTSGEVARGTAFVPMHWNDQFASDARVGALVNPVVDPVSGEPEFKHTPARIEPFHVAWHGFVLTRTPRDLRGLTWWALARGNGLLRYEIAGRTVPPDWCAFAQELLGSGPSGYLDYHDAAAGVYRAARVVDGRLEACAFFSPRADLPSRAWLSSLFARARLEEAERAMLLAAAPATGMEDSGPIVCSCYGVGRETIARAVARHALRSPREVGAHLRAGTNCGSCVAEITTVITEAALSERARPV
jgi:assimilatory nitrate reductase catalytic subunit